MNDSVKQMKLSFEESLQGKKKRGYVEVQGTNKKSANKKRDS